MSIILRNFATDCISGVWKLEENETDLLRLVNLSDIDLQWLATISNAKRRREIIAVRVLLQNLGLNFQINYKNGKPYCNNGFISISHSKSMVAVIYHTKHEVTVDIEEINDKLLRIGERVFSENEIAFANKDLEKLTILWNCKECAYKIFGNDHTDFKHNIKILPFNNDEKIICEIENNNGKQILKLNCLKIENNMLVWNVIIGGG